MNSHRKISGAWPARLLANGHVSRLRASAHRALIANGPGSGDRAVPDDEVAVHQAGDLPGRDGLGGIAQRQRRDTTGLERGDAAAAQARVVAKPDRVDPGGVAVQAGAAQLDRLALQLALGPDPDLVRRCVRAEHIEGLSRGDADAPALADREVVMAPVLAERPPAGLKDLAAALAEPGVAAQALVVP